MGMMCVCERERQRRGWGKQEKMSDVGSRWRKEEDAQGSEDVKDRKQRNRNKMKNEMK